MIKFRLRFKTEKELCEFLGIEYTEPAPAELDSNDCIPDKCTWPNCQCHADRVSIITLGELDRKGISNKWLRIWAEMQSFCGGCPAYKGLLSRGETPEQFLLRLQKEIQ